MVSWESRAIVQLRERFRDLIHPLSSLEIRVSWAMVRAKYIDTEGLGRKGAFRVHPRLPALQIWPDLEDGYAFVQSMVEMDEDIIEQIERTKRVRDAREALMAARSRGEPPRREDWLAAQEADALPIRARRPTEDETKGRIVMLREIEDAVRMWRSEIIQRQRAFPAEPVEIRLDPKAPIHLMRRIQILLVVQYG